MLELAPPPPPQISAPFELAPPPPLRLKILNKRPPTPPQEKKNIRSTEGPKLESCLRNHCGILETYKTLSKLTISVGYHVCLK